MLQSYVLGTSTTLIDGASILTGTLRAQSLYTGSLDAYKINTNNLAAGSITTALLAVGPQYQFRSTNGGQQMVLNQDGSLSLNPNTALLNPTDNRWVMDATRSYGAGNYVKTFAATFNNPNNVGFGILLNLAQGSAFSTSGSNGLLIWYTGGNLQVYRCQGVGAWQNTGVYAVTPTGTDRLMIQYYGSQLAPRMRIFWNGIEVSPNTFTDSMLAASGGAQGGCAGFLLTDSSIKVSEIVMGNQTVTIADGTVTGQSVQTQCLTASHVVISSIVGGINSGSTIIDGGKINATQAMFDNATVGNLTAFSAKIAGTLAATALVANSVTTQQLSVSAINFVNNYTRTGNLTDWGAYGYTISDIVGPSYGVSKGPSGAYITVHRFQSNGNAGVLSSLFPVDATKSYKAKLSIYCDGTGVGSRYFGLYFYDVNQAQIGGYILNQASGTTAPSWDTNLSTGMNPYFWSGNYPNSWVDLTGYVMAADAPANAVPSSPLVVNDVVQTACTNNWKMPPGTCYILLRYLNYYNSGTYCMNYFANPSFTEIDAGLLTADSIRAGSLRSQGSSGGYATYVGTNTPKSVGFKIAHDPFTVNLRDGTTYSVQAEFSNAISIGGCLIGDVTYRTLGAFDAPAWTSSTWAAGTARIFYKGNNDNQTKGGAPDIGCFSICDYGEMQDAGTFSVIRFQWKLQPTAPSSNLDAMRYARVVLYGASGATALDTFYIPLMDRLYANTTDSNAANAVMSDFTWCRRVNAPYLGSAPYPFTGHLKITLYNAYGPSDERWFHSPSSVGSWYTQDNNPPSGGTGGSGGGGTGGGGGYCPWIETPIEILGGRTARLGDVRVNDYVWAREESGTRYALRRVTGYEVVLEPCLEVRFTDGRSLVATPGHRVGTFAGWTEIQDLLPGAHILGPNPAQVRSITPVGILPVVRMTVEDFHTYVTAGVLSHNQKLQSLN